MIKNTKIAQKVRVLPSTDHEYSGRVGVFHYEDKDSGELSCTVTFGDGIPTYFSPEELEEVKEYD